MRTMHLPMSNLVPDREAVSPFVSRMCLRIEAAVDEHRPFVDPQGTENVALPTDGGYTESLVKVVEIEADVKVLFEDVLDGDWWGELHVLVAGKPREQEGGLVLEELFRKKRNLVCHVAIASCASVLLLGLLCPFRQFNQLSRR
jgi:hypothetical protein